MRLKQIDFLKFLFILIILYGHIIQHFMMPQFSHVPFFSWLIKHTSYSFGYLCEGFFIISGFFFVKYLCEQDLNIKHFIISKMARFLPVVLFEICGRFVLCLIGWEPGDFSIVYANVPALFLIPNSITVYVPSYLNWFIGSLFYSYLFFCLLRKIINGNSFYYLTAIICILSYSILFNKLELYNEPVVWNGIFSFYFIRGIAGVGLGIIIGRVFNLYPPKQRLHDKCSIFWSLVELTMGLLLIYLCIIHYERYGLIPILTCFVIIFCSFLYNRTYISKFVSKNYFVFLAKPLFSIYIIQFLVLIILNHTLYFNSIIGVEAFPLCNVVFSIIFVYLCSFIVYYFIEERFKRIILTYFN